MVKLRTALISDMGHDPVLGEISLKGNKDTPIADDVRTKVTDGVVAFEKRNGASWDPAELLVAGVRVN